MTLGGGGGASRGRGRGDAHIRRVYPPGSSNSPARHSPSASRALAARPAQAATQAGTPTRCLRVLCQCSDRRTGSSGAALPELCCPGGRTPSILPPELGDWAEGRARPPLCSPAAPTAREGRSLGEGGSSLSRKTRAEPGGGQGAALSPWGRCRAGGGGGGGDSAALRPPPRNFAAAGAAVATGTECFCSPMSGLPGQAGDEEAATPQWDPGPATLPRGLPAITGSSPLPPRHLPFPQAT